MIYIICFSIALLLLLYIISYAGVVDYNIVLLCVVVAISNGGYYALSVSTNLEEAILGNTLSYVLGIFSPLLFFLIMCSICRLRIPNIAVSIMCAIQIFIYMTVCTCGKLDIFYKTIQFHQSEAGTYLTKTYGPMHTVYLISLAVYTVAGIVVAIYSISRKTVVSRTNVDIMLFVDLFTISVYANERLVKNTVELMPIAATITLIIILMTLIKISVYSPYNNPEIIDSEVSSSGYIVFSKRVKYMSSSEYAKVIFPEIAEWELEKPIPGDGGKFNTYLRPALTEFINNSKERTVSNVFRYKEQIFCYEIGKIRGSGRSIRGYYIRVFDVTNIPIIENK
ncbi:hypothetical protein D6855_01035 [Butyrivibrio sp. CB08]|uniref:histidine kinase N-terminal 7TM domain-containing protein n=1 Tax=Butyrivibrio sp. CB08 TaxID=2364879 RepID=UPI000EA9BBEF|nr:histidine kinase N-terminal 7TM domain-containing protein [Butyrivibrio sp. CB08]RKM62033.1 hypothetical protein D6855_01035 [Butyrivibrio sp. CB08]